MNNEEIKKALEDFYHRAENTNLSYHIFESEREVLKDALTLINRQQAEIERLKGNLFTISNACMQRRNEAIKEFAERLKATYPIKERHLDSTKLVIRTFRNSIDNLLTEMAGGEDDTN